MELYDAVQKINELNEQIAEILDVAIQATPVATAEDLGLDPRSASRLWVCDEGIFVYESSDRSLQYYGGFEYVDKNCRKEYGDYVFYNVNDDRVWRHVDTYYSNIEKGGETLEPLLK